MAIAEYFHCAGSSSVVKPAERMPVCTEMHRQWNPKMFICQAPLLVAAMILDMHVYYNMR